MNTAQSVITEISSYKFIYNINFSTILNLVFEFIQNDNNYLHFSIIKINAQKAINYAIIKIKIYYDNHYQFKFFQSENKM